MNLTTKVTLSPTHPEYSPIIMSVRDAGIGAGVAKFVTALWGS
jgi:hypothetical protein